LPAGRERVAGWTVRVGFRNRFLWWPGRSAVRPIDRAVIATGVVVLLAGCSGFGGTGTAVPGASPTPTAEATATPEPTGSPGTTTARSCERPTPRPVPDMRFSNRLDESRSLTVTVEPRNGSSAVFEETLSLGADEEVDRHDVVSERARYRIAASLPGNTSATTTMEIQPRDRYGIVTVILREDRILVERLGIHPEPTPTPCPP
jgi:hypothetical protein